MLQQPDADDYVVATGESHSVRELVEVAFGVRRARLAAATCARTRRFSGPAEVDLLIGDAAQGATRARLEAARRVRRRWSR